MSDFKSNEALNALRDKLRSEDDEIIKKIMIRMDIVRDIGLLKQAQGIDIFDPAREEFNRERSRAISSGKIPTAMVDQVTDLLAHWARDIQRPLK